MRQDVEETPSTGRETASIALEERMEEQVGRVVGDAIQKAQEQHACKLSPNGVVGPSMDVLGSRSCSCRLSTI
jgi:hypothetical protein